MSKTKRVDFPVGQPYLFAGKERRRFSSLDDSDQEQWSDGSDIGNDYMRIIGDENGKEIFEFLADNTDVEYSHIQTGEDPKVSFFRGRYSPSSMVAG